MSLRARDAFDRLDPGPRAILKRAGTADEVWMSGFFWRIAAEAGAEEGDRRWLAQLVACFPVADQRASEGFNLGAHVRKRIFADVKVDALPKRGVAFRRLLAARDRDDLVHQLRRILQRASQPRDNRSGVDWSMVGEDLRYFNDHVRRRWATGFYTTGTWDAEDMEGEIQ